MNGSVLLLWVIIAVPVGLIVAGMIVGRIKSHHTTVSLRGKPAEVLTDVRLAISQVRGHRTHQDTPTSLVVEFVSSPGWVPLVCVLLFPVGLLALLARSRESSTIIAGTEGGHTVLRISGRFDQRAIGQINNVIEARS